MLGTEEDRIDQPITLVQLEVKHVLRSCLLQLTAIQTIKEVLPLVWIWIVETVSPVGTPKQCVEVRGELWRFLEPVNRFVHEGDIRFALAMTEHALNDAHRGARDPERVDHQEARC